MWHLAHDVHKVTYFNILTKTWSMFYNHFMSITLKWLLILSPKYNYFRIPPLQIAQPTTPGAWTLYVSIYLYLSLLNLIFHQSRPCQLSILFSAINYPHSHHLSFGLLLPFLISCCHQNDLFKMQIKELYYLGKNCLAEIIMVEEIMMEVVEIEREKFSIRFENCPAQRNHQLVFHLRYICWRGKYHRKRNHAVWQKVSICW